MSSTPSILNSAASLRFSAHWSRPWITASAWQEQEKQSQELLVKWSIPARARSKNRPPVNVTFVLDRSGSMNDAIQKTERTLSPIPHTPWVQPAIPTPFPGHPFTPSPMPSPWPSTQPDPFGSGPVWSLGQLNGVTTGVPSGDDLGVLSMSSAIGGSKTSQLGAQQAALDALTQINSWPSKAEPAVNKLQLAKDAAWSAIQTLTENDTVSIVSFDNQVRIVCKNVSGSDKQKLRQALDSIVCGGSTALFDGWREGARCVAENMKQGTLNRVLLLTDGQANHGEVRTDNICSMVNQLAQTGVSTSTFGVGLDYNEDLLQAMAQSGDGNYYHISNKDDFLTLFGDEFDGLSSLEGRQVRLEVQVGELDKGASGAPWATWQSLNAFAIDEKGHMKLPNLMAGRALEVVLNVQAVGADTGSLNLRLIFVNAQGEEQSSIWNIQVPVVQSKTQADAQMNQEVIDAAAILRVAQQKKQAMEALDLGNVELAASTLRTVGAYMASASNAVATAQTMSLNSLAQSLEDGDHIGSRKMALYEVYNTRSNKTR